MRCGEGTEVGAGVMVRMEAVGQRDVAKQCPFEGLNEAAGRSPVLEWHLSWPLPPPGSVILSKFHGLSSFTLASTGDL